MKKIALSIRSLPKMTPERTSPGASPGTTPGTTIPGASKSSPGKATPCTSKGTLGKALPLAMALALAACTSKPSVVSQAFDSSTLQPPAATFTLPEVRLGGVRYSPHRSEEREALAWYFTPDGKFQRGVPRQDQDEYESVKAKIYEVGVVETGRYKGHRVERWDVMAESVPASGAPQIKNYHYYFLRSDTSLFYLPAMARGTNTPELWKVKDVLPYLRERWNLGLVSDTRFVIPELKMESKIAVPGQGVYQAAPAGESIALTEMRLGAPTPLTSLGRGRELLRVPGDWLVCLYPDGLAVHLKKTN